MGTSRAALCSAHLARHQAHGNVLADVPVKTRVAIDSPFCAVEGCGYLRQKGRTYCPAHHGRFRRPGDPQADIPVKRVKPDPRG